MFFELGLEGFAPLTVVMMRLGTATVFLFILFANRLDMVRIVWRYKYTFAMLGLLGCAFPFACFAYGQLFVNSSTAGVINSLMPLFTYLFAACIGQERFKAIRLVGFGLGCAGVAVLLVPNDEGQTSIVLGGLLCMVATISYGICAVLIKRYTSYITPAQLATGMITWSAILTLPFMLAIEGIPQGPFLPSAVVGGCAMGLLGTALAYKIYAKLIDKLGATNAAISVFIVPVNAIFLGVLILGENVNLWFFLGTAMIMIAIVCIDSNISSCLQQLLSRLTNIVRQKVINS